MPDRSVPKLAKWPFLLGDVLLLAAAGAVYLRGAVPLSLSEGALMGLCVAAGAVLAVLPFILEYRAIMKVVEASALTDVVAKVGQMESVAGQIAGATGRWQVAQEAADKTATAAREIAERMQLELKNFSEFMKRTSDGEKATLRLEVEKLRRAEGEWLQVIVRILDQVYALQQGAIRSGQPALIEQISLFQHACRDAARRVGLEPFVPSTGEPFDPEKHQLMTEESPGPNARLGEVIAAGYTFQSRPLRRALVNLATPESIPSQSAQA